MDSLSLGKYLPFVVAGIIIIETIFLVFVANIKKPVRVLFSSFVSNAASFVIPRMFLRIYLFENIAASNWLYIVLYFFITLVFELPITWLLLKDETKDVLRLIISDVAANFVSLILLIVGEKIIIHFF